MSQWNRVERRDAMTDDKKTIMMMCPKLTCRKILSVPETARGKTIRCRNCGTISRVPAAAASAPEAPAGRGKGG